VSKELETRNKLICQQYSAGATMGDIASDHDISRQRVAQIIADYSSNVVSDDETRSAHRARLDHLLGKAMEIVNAGPVQAFDVKGEPLVSSDGHAVMDYEGVIKAMDEARKLSDSIRRMDALDLPRRKQIPEDEAMRQVKEYLKSLPEAQVIPEDEG
jgi:hypothetical protein